MFDVRTDEKMIGNIIIEEILSQINIPFQDYDCITTLRIFDCEGVQGSVNAVNYIVCNNVEGYHTFIVTRSISVADCFHVSIEATTAHSNNVIGADRHGIQENLRDLFDSIKENDVRKTEARRHFLEGEAARQQQVFDTMKEELRLRQQRHIYKRRNVHHGSGDADERAVAFKREITESVTSTTTLSFSNSTLSDEEIWIQTYGTHQNDSGVWPFALSLKENEDMLKLFCIKAHEKLNNTVLEAVDAHVGFFPVMFQNRNITPVWADLIQYSEDRPRISAEVFSYLYMIKGNRPDCVFYIKEHEQHEDRLTDMVFAEHVCGIEGFEGIELQPGKTKKKKVKKTPA